MPLFDLTIAGIHSVPRRAGWVRVRLSDGSHFDLTESRCVDLRLRPQSALGAAQLQACRDAAAVDAIKHRALRLLSTRARSRSDLAARLRSDETDACHVEQALDELTSAGFIDDAAFARQLFEQELDRGPGRAGLARGRLQRAGLDERLIEDVESQLAPDAAAEARALVERRVRAAGSIDRPKLAARLFRLLASRGFDEQTSRFAIESVLGTMEHEHEDFD